jgi:2-hydroxy-3-keto-5-methylthiopentenyl-1-phosphate phosphatase
LFNTIEKYSIPTYIVSGGIKNIIELLFETVSDNYQILKKNRTVNIVSNELFFDEQTGEVQDYSKPIVYTFNKRSVRLLLN